VVSRDRNKKFLVVNPPLQIKREFIDYPYFSNLGALQNAAVLEGAGFHTLVADAFSTRRSSAYPVGRDRYLIGCGNRSFFSGVEEDDFDAILVCLSVFHRPFSADSFTSRFLDELVGKFPEATLAVADASFGGMHYIDYDSESFFINYPMVDCLMRYETEKEVLEWADAIAGGGENSRVRIGRGKDITLDSLPFPAWHLVDTDAYFRFLSRFFKSMGRREYLSGAAPYLPVVTSRGCLYGCSFCSTPLVSGKGCYRRHSLEYSADYITYLKEQYSIKGIAVLDAMANGNTEDFELFLQKIESLELKVSFVNGLRVDRLNKSHIKVLSRVSPSIAVSVESANSEVRNRTLKKNLSLDAVENIACLCRKYGLPLEIHYMTGIPGESVSQVNETLQHALSMNALHDALPLVQYCVPLPGTSLHGHCLEKGMESIFPGDDYFEFFSRKPIFKGTFPGTHVLSDMVSFFKCRLRWAEPEKVIINLTYRCNNRCVVCAVGDRRKCDMDTGVCLELLGDYYGRGARAVDLDGGEPTMHPDFFTIIEAARKTGYEKITVTTNGRRLSSSREFVSRIMVSGITGLLISLYSHDRQRHDEITQVAGSFDQTVSGILNVLELQHENIDFGVNTVLLNNNYMYIVKLMEMLADMEVPVLNVQFLTPFGRARREYAPPLKEACGILEDAISIWEKKIAVRVINLPPCAMPQRGELAVADIEKYSRHMAFVDSPPENLGQYLGRKRVRTDQCKNCIFFVVCEGFYSFEGEKPDFGRPQH